MMKLNKVIRNILFLVALLLCMGCKTQYIPVVEYRERVVHDTIVKIDSVQVADSVIDRQRERQSGDTIFVERVVERWRTRWRTRTEVQTIEVHHVDSILQPVEVVREVPLERSGYDKFCSWFFWIVIVVLFLLGAFLLCDKIPACKPYTAVIKGLFKFL